MYFFEEWNQKYIEMEKILKGMTFSKKLEILKNLKLVNGDMYNDLHIISICRNKFVHPPIIESIDELLSLEAIKTKEFKTVAKQISEIKSSEEFMEIYQKVCKYINKILEEIEVKWILKFSKEMWNKLPEEVKKQLPFEFH